MYPAVLSYTLLEGLFNHMLVQRSLMLSCKQRWEKSLKLRKTKTRKVQNPKEMHKKQSQIHSHSSWISMGNDYSCKGRYGVVSWKMLLPASLWSKLSN